MTTGNPTAAEVMAALEKIERRAGGREIEIDLWPDTDCRLAFYRAAERSCDEDEVESVWGKAASLPAAIVALARKLEEE